MHQVFSILILLILTLMVTALVTVLVMAQATQLVMRLVLLAIMVMLATLAKQVIIEKTSFVLVRLRRPLLLIIFTSSSAIN